MKPDADVLIVGGGCAGLSLATALAQRAPHLRVHTLEQRDWYKRDRTWCFWNTTPHPFQAAVTHQWSSWRVRFAGSEARQHSSLYTYNHIPADRFYELATHITANAGQQHSMAIEVTNIQQNQDLCQTETSAGTLSSRWVFDARPRSAAETRPALLQRFLGWHVRTEHPCFTPGTVELMDFQPITVPGSTPFIYVLPFSPTEALVEATYLDDPDSAPADAAAAVRQYLQALRSGAFQILYEEAGALPMGGQVAARPPASRIIDIGARGGRLKASSGYGFLRIQRQSLAFAQALAHNRPMPRHVEPRHFALLDQTFLSALQRFPDRAPGYFLTLFQTLAPDLLVRFLSETATPAEILQVMLVLPKLDFLRAALSNGTRTHA